MTLIPSPEDLGIVNKLDGNLFDVVLAIIGNKLRDNIKTPNDALDVDVSELERTTSRELPTEMMEMITDHVSMSGWKVLKHYSFKRLDLFVISAPKRNILVRSKNQ